MMSSVASLRQIRRRIRSVENTKKITRAMEMVAAAKLRRFQDFLESARPYTERMEELLQSLVGPGSLRPQGVATTPLQTRDFHHPFLEQAEPESILLVLFTSDTGLCGAYNSDLENLAQRWIRENPEREIRFVFVGKHGARVLGRKPNEVLASFADLRVSHVDEILGGLRKTLETAFLNSGVSAVETFYTRMESLSRYHPTRERLLPISRRTGGQAAFSLEESPIQKSSLSPSLTDFLLEPDRKTVLDKLIPAFFEARLRFIFYHALLTEQIARMAAMRQATQNAKEMIDELTLLRNKARQAAITKEIIEVVSGSRALRLK